MWTVVKSEILFIGAKLNIIKFLSKEKIFSKILFDGKEHYQEQTPKIETTSKKCLFFVPKFF